MYKYCLLFSLVSSLHLLSCNNNPQTKNDIPADSITATAHSKQEDPDTVKLSTTPPDTVIPKTKTQSTTTDAYLEIADSLKKYPVNLTAAFKRQMEWLALEWKNTPNPITASYQGTDFGDYQHILFKADNGNVYDFGQANNNYGKYQLHKSSGQYEDNPKFIGKPFKIFWAWKPTEFSCCEGEYNMARAPLPTIIKLELINN